MRRAKRRRMPPQRTTTYLDLHPTGELDDSQQTDFGRLVKVLRTARKIVVVAGAGISVSAGSKFGPVTWRQLASTDGASQFPIFGRLQACLEPSRKDTSSKVQAGICSTPPCTEMISPPRPFTT